MNILQIGLAKSGNLWLYTMIQKALDLARIPKSSYITKQPIYEVARNWPLSFKGHASVDCIEFDQKAVYCKIDSAYKMRITDLSSYTRQTTHCWTHSSANSPLIDEVLKAYDKKVYIIRDPRDVIISAAEFTFTPYARQFHPCVYKNISDCLHRRYHDSFGNWWGHIQPYLQISKCHNIHVMFYERLLTDFDKEVSRLLDYLELSLNKAQFAELKQAVTFSSMKKDNQSHCRHGAFYGWTQRLNEAQQSYARHAYGNVLSFLDYPLDSIQAAAGKIPKLPDNTSLMPIPRKITTQERLKKYLCDFVKALQKNNEKVIIVGAGRHTELMIEHAGLRPEDILLLADDDPLLKGTSQFNLTVHAIDDIFKIKMSPLPPVVLSSNLYQMELYDNLKDLCESGCVLYLLYNSAELKRMANLAAQIMAPPPAFSEHRQQACVRVVQTMDALGFTESLRCKKSVDAENNPLPWYTYSAIAYLDQFDLSDKSIFEWGSGNSSMYFSRRCRKVRSIECSPDWYQIVFSQKLHNQEIHLRKEKEFAQAIDEFKETYDIIIIDAEMRLACAEAAMKWLAPNGIIILDNADNCHETCAALREYDLLQVDFHGFAPVCLYLSVTSFFFRRSNRLVPLDVQPVPPFGGIQRNLDYVKTVDIRTPNISFVSPENIILEKLFRSMRGSHSRFYVDIGSHHPIKQSLTYNFYIKGWTGINIEPRPGSKKLFDELRPTDINVETAAGLFAGEVEYYIFNDPVCNTCDSQQALKCGEWSVLQERKTIPIQRLDVLLKSLLKKDQLIDLLKIGAWGEEDVVLQSNDWNNFSPAVIVLEQCIYHHKRLPSLDKAIEFLLRQEYHFFKKTSKMFVFAKKELCLL